MVKVLHNLIVLHQFCVALGNLTITYTFQQQPDTEPGSASIVINITCNWNLSIENVAVTPEEEAEVESCSTTASFQSGTIVLTCTNLEDGTFYDAAFETMVHLENETYSLQFSIPFDTEDIGFVLSSKLCSISKHIRSKNCKQEA